MQIMNIISFRYSLDSFIVIVPRFIELVHVEIGDAKEIVALDFVVLIVFEPCKLEVFCEAFQGVSVLFYFEELLAQD